MTPQSLSKVDLCPFKTIYLILWVIFMINELTITLLVIFNSPIFSLSETPTSHSSQKSWDHASLSPLPHPSPSYPLICLPHTSHCQSWPSSHPFSANCKPVRETPLLWICSISSQSEDTNLSPWPSTEDPSSSGSRLNVQPEFLANTSFPVYAPALSAYQSFWKTLWSFISHGLGTPHSLPNRKSPHYLLCSETLPG